MYMIRTSYYTPFCNAFKKAFNDIPCVTTFESEYIEDGICKDFQGTVYIDKLEFVSIIVENGRYMVYINNPGCDVDDDGSPIFTKEHPQQQWVFGNYVYFKNALNKAVAITKARKYPKPILIW